MEYTNESEWQFMMRSAHYVEASRHMKSEEAFETYYDIIHNAFAHLLDSAQNGVYMIDMYTQSIAFYEYIDDFSGRLRETEAVRCNTLSVLRTQLRERYAV